MDDTGAINIIIANDNPDQLALMKMALTKAGYGVLTAADGREAFDAALREPVEIIISDVMMPNVSGIELCRLVRGHPALKSLPILLVSALRKDTESVVEGLRSGADAYIESPFDLMHLIAVITRLIERKRGEDHIRRLNEELEVRVRERTAELELANFELGREVAERRAIEFELERARDEALVAARLKAEFAANVSHEIRSPMHAILGMVGLLSGTPLKPKQREFADSIRESAESLLTTINDVLDFSKIEAGKLRLNKTDFDLHDVVEASVHMFVEKARAKRLALSCLVEDGVPPLLRGDPGRLRQVLVNLLSNAVKFTEAGEVMLRVTPDHESADGYTALRFEVTDTGIGISPEQLRRIFLPFTQADGSDARPYGGTGLGLAISRQLVELMGGEIGVESEPGHGSTFWFTINLTEQPAGPPDAALSGLDGLRVFVVVADTVNRDILIQQAAQWNMRPAAGDAERALRLLREAEDAGRPFDFVLLELQTPGGRAIDLARQIRADAQLRDKWLLLITASVLGQEEEAEYEKLFDAFLTMPMRRQQLSQCLLALLHRAQKHAADPGGEAPTRALRGEGGAVLVAEDNPFNQKLMSYLLEELGFEAVIVPNGLSALAAHQRGEYALVLMDCQMPEMDGYAATAELRRREGAARHTPVIAMTADALPGTRERCLAAGMDDCLIKPFTREELEAVIERWRGGTFAPPPSPAADETAGADDVLDLRLIARLRGFRRRGDESTLVALVETFLRDTGERRDAIIEACGARDRERVRREAHALKGSAGFFGAVSLSKVCAELIDLTASDNLPPADEVLELLDGELLRVTRRLDEWRRVRPSERGAGH